MFDGECVLVRTPVFLLTELWIRFQFYPYGSQPGGMFPRLLLK